MIHITLWFQSGMSLVIFLCIFQRYMCSTGKYCFLLGGNVFQLPQPQSNTTEKFSNVSLEDRKYILLVARAFRRVIRPLSVARALSFFSYS